jgi:competence protein ComEA
MFASRRDAVADEVRDRFVRVVGLPDIDDAEGPPVPTALGAEVPAAAHGVPLRAADDRGLFPVGEGAVPATAPPIAAPLAGDPPGEPFVGDGAGARPTVGSALRPRLEARNALGAFDPGRRGVRALALVAVVAVAVAGFLAWRARPRVDPVAATAVTASAPAAGPSAVPTGVLIVAVTGRVRRPGLVRLPAGARVADAVEAAGGVSPDTDLSLVNLARKLVDGELVAIGITPPPGAAGPDAGTAAGGGPAGPLNLNTATAAQFEALPGIGPVLAQHLVEYRTRHGQFRSVDELRQVEGLGAARFAQLKPLVTV